MQRDSADDKIIGGRLGFDAVIASDRKCHFFIFFIYMFNCHLRDYLGIKFLSSLWYPLGISCAPNSP